jgi:hypothetical protein
MSIDDYARMMNGFSEVTKTYVQLAVAALVLPLTFIRDILGVATGPLQADLNIFLFAGWGMLLLSIGAGMLYQVIAARRIAEELTGSKAMRSFPRTFFQTCVISFFGGIFFFVVGMVTSIF